jgi:signal transduction histidine kinase
VSSLATVLVSWAAVHVFVACCYAFLFFRQQHGAEYLSFALLSVALAVFSVSSAVVQEAPDGFTSSIAQNGQFIAIAAGLATFVAFASQLLDLRGSPWTVFGAIYAMVTTIAALSGALFDPGRPLPIRGALVPFAPVTHEVAMEPTGVAIIVVGVVLGTAFIADLRRKAKGNPDVRMLTVVGAIVIPAWVIDAVARVAQLRTFYIFGHAAIFGTIMVSYVLMRRFVQAGDELERRTLELRRSYDELRHVQEELVHKEQLAAVGELSAVIAHEVRNPLAVLKNAVSGLRRQELSTEDRATLFSILDEETDRLNRLVRDLLAYARPVEPQSTPLPVEPIVRKAIDLAFRGNARSSSIDIKVELAGVPASVEGDKDLIERALINIVENALQAMPNGGRLVVTGMAAEYEGELMVTLAFRDTGEGMDTLVRSRARDPFFTTRPSGTGLGLAIVERVIRAHGGTVELAKNDDAGSTVKVTLPARRRAGAARQFVPR